MTDTIEQGSAIGDFIRTDDGLILTEPQKDLLRNMWADQADARRAYRESASEVSQLADVMKQWFNPCVRDAQTAWMRRYD
jgi:hypothetical protein